MIYKFTQLYRAGTDPLIGYPVQTDNLEKVTNEQNNGKIFVYSGETNEQYTKGGLYLIEGYEEPSLTPFNVGDTINKGTTYTFDKSKGSDIEAMLNGLSYEYSEGLGFVDLLGTTINGEREPTLCAFDFGTAKVLCVLDSDTYIPIYATGDFNVGNGFIVGTKGWNIDGETYTLVKTSRSSTINSILETTPAWNGVLVGKVASEVIEPSLTPFAVGDTVTAGMKYVFDTTKEAELLALAQSLEGSYDGSGQYGLLNGDGSAIIGLAKAPGDTPTYVLMVADGDTPVFAWSSAELQGMGLTKGWQSSVSNGEYTITSERSETITAINNGEAWNGIIVGKA